MVDEGEKKILEKYGEKLAKRIGEETEEKKPSGIFTREYEIFRKETLLITTSFYEKACKWAENLLLKFFKPKLKEEDVKKLEEAIKTAHLEITPISAACLGYVVLFFSIFLGIIISLFSFALTGSPSILSSILVIILGIFAIKPITNYPITVATKWRIEASNQMVPCILYVVMYMRHTSNLEHAIKFAGEHVGPPLALDLRKVFWDVEVKKYSTIRESLENYLNNWKKWNFEFVEAFHLIEASLHEADEKKRIATLEKALEIMLEGTYEKMLKFAHETKNPITMLHMFGVILPILGLIILPLLGSFMNVKWYHIGMLYNIALPIAVYYFGHTILVKRPTGYSQTKIEEKVKNYKELRMLTVYSGGTKKYVKPETIALLLILVFMLFGTIPLIIHVIYP
ncbi:hypothetical protein DRN69_08890, partial [Candidatus Pacearchaeota archaeon]